MPIVKCKICKNGFYAKPFWLLHGWGKYCSNQCKRIGQRTGKMVDCFLCGRATYKAGKTLLRSKSKKYFCGKSCQTVWRNSIIFVGPKHANWKDGAHVEYRNIMFRNKVAQYCRLCNTEDKRVLVVHHIDRNRSNNKLSNLLWLCHNCHFLVHHCRDEREKIMVPIA